MLWTQEAVAAELAYRLRRVVDDHDREALRALQEAAELDVDPTKSRRTTSLRGLVRGSARRSVRRHVRPA